LKSPKPSTQKISEYSTEQSLKHKQPPFFIFL
jgi:hypothetical protein